MPPAARLTDIHSCPKMPAGPITAPGEPTVLICGMPAARLGDAVACSSPEFIASGEDTVLIGGKPAARMGDLTGGPNVCPGAGPGVITTGCPTVLIGKNYHANVLAKAAETGAPFCEAVDLKIKSQLDNTGWFESDSIARDIVNALSDTELDKLTPETKKRLAKELKNGHISQEDKDALNKLLRIRSISIKRKDIDIGGEDKYGHWWLEIDNSESYGWWPKNQVGLGETLGGTDGELNGQTLYGGTSTTDPHHGDPANTDFNPTIDPDDTRTVDEIKNCLRQFANSYSGEWRWTVGAGQNCHTFQKSAMQHCGLNEPY
ncbi:MAG: hypothetical protein DRR16_19025 [Candidatus Parabeggiatoa sp. nov. 3]|nr:MAG: hypothetical protein DRR00_23630 [Gammaproteobacteria bacterium]RKZ58782.1 MAG: hypothetical protein DRQ99_24870 [Gammaproteobacteria bacterium]RKZ82727.1 MAG: hypothetical protein DRR16_19025 [Gammaproteobacteria bacterium]HEC83678.1 hypothetical protein [Thioploca sp.]